MIQWKNEILLKEARVNDLLKLSRFIMTLQLERAAVTLAVFVDARRGSITDLSEEYTETDRMLNEVTWRQFGDEKIFENKLRFQIRIDDFRERVLLVATLVSKNASSLRSSGESIIGDREVLEFYTLGTSRMLTALEIALAEAQSGSNWKILMSYFNMLQLIESSGIGMSYGLRFFSKGKLIDEDIIAFVRTNALMYEYYKQTRELIPADIGEVLHKLFNSEEFININASTAQILSNIITESDEERATKYFEGSMTFIRTLGIVLDLLTEKVKVLAAQDLNDSNMSQVWGILLLVFIMLLSPILVFLAKNAISSIQIFAVSVEKKSEDMKRQKRKQDALILKMLPKGVVDKLNNGVDTAENFESATLFFSTVVDFSCVTRSCKAMEIVNFLNDLYNTMDQRMDQHDVYKVETISDSYLVVSGLPNRNGDKHAAEICRMALDLQAASGMVIRPDIRPRTIQMKCGVHTGPIVAGVVGSKMPRYCLFGDTINTASRMQSTSEAAAENINPHMPRYCIFGDTINIASFMQTTSEAGKIQISNSTNMILDMQGGFKTEERGGVEVKGKGLMQTFWLIEEKGKELPPSSN